ncbi:hypothetical protein OESDEN_12562 [Oesophagostomum dentatum]|uniref:Uncharacterized protein n=1 Tax=Oesophagostomum dentatum TaxID=61180 RepID=A0A0B1SQV6_OESDE|nr:hypothetical protein OESDEN_12562 [Oesophagostomum dentatum]
MDKYLGLDGVFLLRLIAQHADVVFITELIGHLWKSHYEIEEQRMALKRMNLVLPLLRSAEKEEFSTTDSPSTRRNSSVTKRKTSTANRRSSTFKRHASVDEIESVTSKQFADSSSDEELKAKADRRTSLKKETNRKISLEKESWKMNLEKEKN